MRQTLAGQIPVSHKLGLVDRGPAQQLSLLRRGELTGHHVQGPDLHPYLVPAVSGVEVRRFVVARVDPNDDAVP